MGYSQLPTFSKAQKQYARRSTALFSKLWLQLLFTLPVSALSLSGEKVMEKFVLCRTVSAVKCEKTSEKYQNSCTLSKEEEESARFGK